MARRKLYIVTKRIRYHNPEHELDGRLVDPSDEVAKVGLPMDHLVKSQITLLCKKGYLRLKPQPKAKNDD